MREVEPELGSSTATASSSFGTPAYRRSVSSVPSCTSGERGDLERKGHEGGRPLAQDLAAQTLETREDRLDRLRRDVDEVVYEL